MLCVALAKMAIDAVLAIGYLIARRDAHDAQLMLLFIGFAIADAAVAWMTA